MPTGLLNVEWQNLNAIRRYPLADDASGVDTSGAFALPSDLLVELDLPVHRAMDVDPGRFFLRQVNVTANGVFLVVAYQPATGDPVDAATASVFRESHAAYDVYPLGGVE